MGDTISLTIEEQRRVRILTRLVGDDLAIEEAAALAMAVKSRDVVSQRVILAPDRSARHE